MARYGFTGQKLDMKKFILFTMKTLPGPVSRQELFELVTIDENSDYFLFSDAITELIDTEHMFRTDQGLDISARGAEVAAIVENNLPVALRRAVAGEIRQRSEKSVRDACVTAVTRTDGGAVYVDGEMTDGTAPLMRLSLLVGSAEQAKVIEKSFRAKAEEIYGQVLETLLNNE